jgi:pimeloyl-ACP methyl ester carboxylesterase
VKCGIVVAAVMLLVGGCSSANAPVPGGTSAPSASVAAPTSTTETAATKLPLTSPDRQKLPTPDVKPAGFIAPPSGSGMNRYLSQPVEWKACGEYQCAKVRVPLDYSLPDGQAITLAMKKKQATASPRIGTLFINPGGPGASGQDYVDGFRSAGLEQFDIIGWDPRGSGESTPVQCFGTAETDALVGLDASPDDPAENRALIEGTKKYAQSCLRSSGALLAHVSTQDTARDLDVLRQLVGDQQLSYAGVSYGTMIGATYAQLFPDKVGRMVLDGAVNITDDESVIQAMGFDKAFSDFAQWCAKRGCPLGSTAEKVTATVAAWLDTLDQHPIAVGDRVLTQTLAASGLALFMYWDASQYPSLLSTIRTAMNGHGETLLRAADALNDRQGGGYGSMFYGFSAILCADQPDRGVTAAYTQWKADQSKAPFFAKYFGIGYTCPVWTAAPAPHLTITGAGAKPIMVIGGTGDSATPYQQAQWMAHQLTSGFLLTFDGAGHGAYGGKSACVDNHVVAYLTTGTKTAEGTVCKAS